ncbi:hypothetical protein EDB19DRAFT_1917648 [Suillus lakei]|nr:hypothetical protein EDB19DRAFT_1917648 [Suillus lakei]
MKAKLQDATDGLEKGECIKLTKFIAENNASLLRAYGWLTVAEKQAYNVQLLQAHQEKRSAACANPKAIWHDMNAAFTSMDLDSALYSYGAENIFTKKAQKFVSSVLRVEPQHLGLKLEAFVVRKLDEHVISNNSCPLNKLIAECRELIQDGLDFILLETNNSHKVKINYRNYERTIVKHHSVALINWPLSVAVQNPSQIGGRSQVQTLLDALKSD